MTAPFLKRAGPLPAEAGATHGTRRRGFGPVAALVLLASAVAASSAFGATRSRESFDGGWRFHHGDVPGAEQPGFDAAGWREVDLPHDWSIEGPYDEHAPGAGSGGYLPTGIGWYRKTFGLPETMRDRQVEILFDGVYQHSTVWLNGQRLGYRPFGYISFAYDLTPHLRTGGAANELVVKVDNSLQPSSRWYSGSGIYRHVWLITTDPLRIPLWGTFVTTTAAAPERATLEVQTKVRNDRAQAQDVELVSGLIAASGAAVTQAVERRRVAAGAVETFAQSLEVASPQLWSVASPTMYEVRTSVRVAGAVVDEYVTPTGIRTIRFDADDGFLLNDQPVKLRGMCLHHDGGGVGAAVPAGVWERRFRLLREMGCNAVRCSHNPMAPEFYDLCDRLGLLVMNEAFDEWTVRKPQIKYGYSDVFAEWHERDVVDLVHRDRNHPSIILWSAGNEIGEQWASEGPAIVRRLVELFHREDPTRPVTAAMDNIFNQRGPAPVAFSGALDIVGYNYVDRWGSRRETHYADDRHAFPERLMVGTENVSARGVRGEYRFGPLVGGGFRGGRMEPGVGPEGALYVGGPIRAGELWKFVATHDYVIGDFAWTGFDYLGEARWPDKLATSGPLDTCGFKKDAFYFYQSLWTEEPMVHVLPHWNWEGREGTMIPVVAYSNGDTVELFLNGRSLGAKAREFPQQGVEGGWNSYPRPVVRSTTADLFLVWDVLYEPGELKAVAWKEGKPVAETIVRTAGPATALELTLERGELTRGPREVVHATVRTLDARGEFVPLADDEVTFAVTGPAKLLAVDNGDPASHASYQGPQRRLFSGRALAILQRTGEPGTVRIQATAAGLAAARAEVVLDE
jgi:beta-galactosidase